MFGLLVPTKSDNLLVFTMEINVIVLCKLLGFLLGISMLLLECHSARQCKDTAQEPSSLIVQHICFDQWVGHAFAIAVALVRKPLTNIIDKIVHHQTLRIASLKDR